MGGEKHGQLLSIRILFIPVGLKTALPALLTPTSEEQDGPTANPLSPQVSRHEPGRQMEDRAAVRAGPPENRHPGGMLGRPLSMEPRNAASRGGRKATPHKRPFVWLSGRVVFLDLAGSALDFPLHSCCCCFPKPSLWELGFPVPQ